MTKFLMTALKFSTIFILILITCVFINSKIVERRNFRNNETLSNLLVMKDGEHYDLAIMGISHARELSDFDNHSTVEKNLQKKILNIGMGHGLCGINEQLFYLSYAYSRKIKIDTVIFIISPPLIYSDYLNHAAKTFDLEPFRFDFLVQYLNFQAENKGERLFAYIRSKLNPEWLNHRPKSHGKMTTQLTHIDTNAVIEGFEAAYGDGIDEAIFLKNSKRVEELIITSHKNNTEVVFMITPTLFGKWWGHDRTINLCKELNKAYGTPYYDFAETIFIPELYKDHHHLNSNGVDFFTKNYLKPLFNHPILR